MAEFEAQLRDELGELATITRGRHKNFPVEGVDVEPRNPKSVGFYWLDSGEFQFGVGTEGNRWELDDAREGAEFAVALARSVIEGRIIQTTAPARSYVVITLADGTEMHATTSRGLAGLVPRPRWKRWGQTMQYEPYDSGY